LKPVLFIDTVKIYDCLVSTERQASMEYWRNDR